MLSYPKQRDVIGVVVGFFALLAGLGILAWWALDAAKRVWEGR
jgi:hypothetical protein